MFQCRNLVWLVIVAAVTCVRLGAGEKSTVEAPTNTAASATATEQSLLVTETKRYMAQLTEQRNLLREENETLRSREGLLLIYGALLTVLSGWLIFRSLRLPTKSGQREETAPFPAGTGVTVRKNATITIRNSSTQQAEVVEKLETRRSFVRSETGSHSKSDTRPPQRRETPPATSHSQTRTTRAVVAPELEAAESGAGPATRRINAQTSSAKNPATVRIEQQSDRLDPVVVTVKPGTSAARRTA
jgi:hypothetical protein